MKLLFSIIILFLISILTYCQNDSTFLSEYSVSVNTTLPTRYGIKGRTGFGLGIYFVFLPESRINLLFGTEYNRTNIFFDDLSEGMLSNSKNVTFRFNFFSIPLTLRMNMGKNTKYFVETGVFFAFNLGSKMIGTNYTYRYNPSFEEIKADFNKRANITNIDLGPSLGFGINIPVSKIRLIINPEYKFGIIALYDYQEQVYNRYLRLKVKLKI